MELRVVTKKLALWCDKQEIKHLVDYYSNLISSLRIISNGEALYINLTVFNIKKKLSSK